jgi:hypothetical protein
LRKDRRRIAVGLVVMVLAAGCAKYTAGQAFRDEATQDTPEGAVQMWLSSMEWKKVDGVRDPELGRDFDAFVAVSDPDLFKDSSGMTVPEEDMQKLREEWNSKGWEIEFLDLQFETETTGSDSAVVKLVGGQVRYIGKEMFGTTEYKVDDFKDKKGEITLERVDGKWRVIKGKVVNHDEYWTS